MRILVTGGAGFLGSHLCEKLVTNSEDHVICLDNFFTGTPRNVAYLHETYSNFELMRHDVQQELTMAVDQIYHLACPASPVHYQKNPVRTIRTAVEGTLNMLDVARECGARIMIASTSEVYGDPTVHPQVETYWGNVNPIGPRACYDEGKRCAEALAMSYAQQYGVEVRIARIFNTYGPRMQIDDGRVVSNFIVKALQNQPLTVYGDGSQTRSFCHVYDTVNGFIKLMRSLATTPINLGNPVETTILEFAENIKSMTMSSSPIEFHDLPIDDPCRRRPDISKAQELLGWSPEVDLRTGLRSTIEYFRGVLRSKKGT
jgi:UDP-glucuronate decarboxylase